MKISVIIPAYNEADIISNTIRAVKSYFSGTKYDYEIIVADDGSSDLTAQRAKDAGAFLLSGSHMGKGFAVRNGVLNARGDIIIFTDADLAYDLSLISKSVSLICSGADVVIGNRYGGGYGMYGGLRRLCSALFSIASNVLLRLKIADTQCGFKAFEAKAAREIFMRTTLDGFCFDTEVLFVAKKLALTIKSVAASMLAKPKRSSVRPFCDGVRMLFGIFTIMNNERCGRYGPVQIEKS